MKPLDERNRLLLSQIQSLQKNLDAKFASLVREREARRRCEQECRELKAAGKRLVKEEVRLERLKDDQLMVQGRQAFMAEMINNIAHQWRQPINTLGLLAQDLQMTYRLGEFTPEFIQQNLSKTMETVRRMSRTIDDFSTFFRPEFDMVDFRLVKVLGKVRSFLEAAFGSRNIEVKLDADCDPVVHGYPSEFSQVILNILMNARDALLAAKAEKPAVTIRVRRGPGVTQVAIADNAGGIPPEILDRVFDPYFTTKGPAGGTGIGLFMAKSIIERNMGGSLTAANVGDGAEFRIELNNRENAP
ncbi:HAMP domain-containing histidine kinase [Geomonas sp. Red32]|uniref:sensor histidine kinase n=1 Tax=Geomonas sp. Red32 TaxID=2912856 RepID=UPI00202CB493|nr:HAMP domain-containing sensor histidine kinase [Geomonas sp. Red32]MCM0081514.1 HAMP domain-containing histidine kinase [Geomonas sp. Red32]